MCDRFPRKFDVQVSLGPDKLSNYVLGLIFVVNINSNFLGQPITRECPRQKNSIV